MEDFTPFSGVLRGISRVLVLVLLASFSHALGLLPRVEGQSLLRVMPLGASITAGYGSTDGNGYRKWVREQLNYEGWEVDMVGSRRSGTMNDNDNEGHSGYRVDQVTVAVKESLNLQPNLILINAGTNDAIQNYKIDTIGDRMEALLDLLFDNIDDTTIILSTLLPNKRHQEKVDEINSQYREIAAERRADGDNVVLADMSTFITRAHLVDGIHPSDEGYKRMASVWWAAIKVAQFEGMLPKPAVEIRASIQNTTTTETENGSGPDTKSKSKAESSATAPDLPKYTAAPQPVENMGAIGWPKDMHIPALLVFSLPSKHCTVLLGGSRLPWRYGAEDEPPSWQIAVCGGLAGEALWLLSHPLDVIKSKMHGDGFGNDKKYRSMTHAFQLTWRTGGVRGLFQGLGLALLRAMPVSAGTFATVEIVRRLFG